MDISANGNKVVITGNIKSIQDYKAIKETLESVSSNEKSVEIEVVDSISMTSSVIGYMNKLVQKDGIALELRVGSPTLLDLLKDLNLIELLRVRSL